MNSTKSNRDDNRRLENGRLVYYQQTASQDFWESVWARDVTPDYYRPFQAGSLFDFEKMFKRCGNSQLVVALRFNGYACMGLDYAINALRHARQIVGPLPLVAGDLTAICVSDDTFGAIISIGVVEHSISGPEIFLQELLRVLSPGGVLMISVPYFNPLRQWRARRGAFQGNVGGLDFYQYAFSRKEFCRILESVGFKIETTYSYAHQNTLTQELHWLNRLPKALKKFILRISKHMPYVNSELGHMLMVVARKKS